MYKDYAQLIDLTLKIHNLAQRFAKYGMMSLTDFRNDTVNPSNRKAWNAHCMRIVYDDTQTTEEDEESYVVLEHVTSDGVAHFQEMTVTCNLDEDGAYLYVQVPYDSDDEFPYISYIIDADGIIVPMDIAPLHRAMEDAEQNARKNGYVKCLTYHKNCPHYNDGKCLCQHNQDAPCNSECDE